MFDTWTVEVPGRFRDTTAFLDLETRKVPCDYRMPSGETLRRRWSAFLAGVARDGRIVLVEATEAGEDGFLTGVREAVGEARTVTYRATREFDEMILRGRFTNARRAHAPAPYFPAMPDAESLRWVRLRPSDDLGYPRGEDCESRDVPEVYARGEADLVTVHLLRDVAELILADGRPDAECEAWCRRVLVDYDYAWEAVYGGEPEEA